MSGLVPSRFPEVYQYFIDIPIGMSCDGFLLQTVFYWECCSSLSSKVSCEGAVEIEGMQWLSFQLCATVFSGVPYPSIIVLEILLGLLRSIPSIIVSSVLEEKH